MNLADKIERLAERDAFISIKDHKENFENNTKCRLLNPAKSEIGIISKSHLQNINDSIRQQLSLKQWRSTSTVINWFKNIEAKNSKHFLQLDIIDFYPSISEELLTNALAFAKSMIQIEPSTTNIIMHSRKSLLFSDNTVWMKKGESLFDVTMGSHDGAEVCELVGLYLLHQMREKFPLVDFGLYRDDGLGCYKKLPGPVMERTRKEIIQLFKANNLSITIDANMHQVNFLDTNLNLENGKFRPYRKPNDNLLYINKNSNHPPTIKKQLPTMIQQRLSDLSTDECEFNKAKNDYQEALKSSGFNETLKFNQPSNKKRSRKRNIIWFNPPYNSAVKSNIGKKFLSLVEKHFPKRHRFSKIFNRNSIKLSYSCTANIKSVISSHNKSILKPNTGPAAKMCNCREKNNCPLNGQCLQEALIYKATVKSSDNAVREYIGCSEPPFKQRFANHTHSFNKAQHKNSTRLSQHIWELKDQSAFFSIKWEIQARSSAYKCGSSKCDLCLAEKLSILKSDTSISLNKRSEIANKCRHKNKHKLSKLKQGPL